MAAVVSYYYTGSLCFGSQNDAVNKKVGRISMKGSDADYNQAMISTKIN